MLLIRSDNTRLIDIPGVPTPVRRPIDIDQAITGFSSLRTLRIYKFDAGAVIEGHAEEDEVFIIVLAGSIELTIATEDAAAPLETALLSAPGALREACAAYLSPGSSYKLIATSEADVAYARATPRKVRRPRIFMAPEQGAGAGVHLLLEDTTCAERISFRLVRIDAASSISFAPAAREREQLIHVTSDVPGFSAVASNADTPNREPICSGDTLVIAPGDQPVIRFAEKSRCLVLILTTK